MMKLEVSNFGPIKKCSFDIDRFMVFIGPQGSGKSTLSKLVYYCLNLRDEIAGYILDTYENSERLELQGLNQRLIERFREFFGPTPHSENLNIRFIFGDNKELTITCTQNDTRYVFFRFSDSMRRQLFQIFNDLRSESQRWRPSALFTTFEVEKERDNAFKAFKNRCAEVFGIDKELLFIPAGRSSLPVFSDQVGIINTQILDYPMRKFIARMIQAKSRFGQTLDKIISEIIAINGRPFNEPALRKAEAWVGNILKGEYIFEGGEERLYINSDLYVKINLASSGQQEVLWLLIFLFSIVADRVNTMVFIEEPEAHLFPETQKNLVEFISFVHSVANCDFFITTHSPYILTAANNLMYAHTAGRVSEQRAREVIPKDIWLPPENVGGYFVNNGELEGLYSHELKMFRAELIDKASEKVEELFDKLSDIVNEETRE